MSKTLLVFLFAYLAGSINFAILFFRITGRQDPRLNFSGNAGTTNVYRQAGMAWATVIFLLEIGRAVGVAALAIYSLEKALLPWAGFFLVLGNSYPCFHGFRGGKGVANYLGFTLLVSPWTALAAAFIWVAVYYGVKRTPFIASFFMVFTLACGQAFSLYWQWAAMTGAIATFTLILMNHRKNITAHRSAMTLHNE